MKDILTSIMPNGNSPEPVFAASIEDCQIGQSIQVGNDTYKMINTDTFMDSKGNIVPRTFVGNLSSILDPYKFNV